MPPAYGANQCRIALTFDFRRRVAAKAGQYSVGFEAAVHALNSWGERRLTPGMVEELAEMVVRAVDPADVAFR